MKVLEVVIFVGLCLALLVEQSAGHGMMLDPPGRSSRWRFDPTAPVNYNDNELYCGGFTVQWNSNGGKCCLCGDNYATPKPRPNELGGIYGGKGVIVRTYKGVNTATIGFDITANHLGYISLDICNLDKYKVESDECFSEYHLKFIDGQEKFYIGSTKGMINAEVNLPNGLKCEHCVLRWTYTAGNNWGICENGTGAAGCGPQETFRSCADIRIEA